MKTILLLLCLTLFAWADPVLKGTITQTRNGTIYLLVQGNPEVRRLKVITPIDPYIITHLPENALWIRMPESLPEFPSILFLVNDSIYVRTKMVDLDYLRRTRGHNIQNI